MKRPGTVVAHHARPDPSHRKAHRMAKANRTLFPFIYIAIELGIALALVAMMALLLRGLS